MKFLVRSLLVAAALVGTAHADTPAPAPKKTPAPAEKTPAKTTPPADTKKAELPPKEVEELLAFFNKFVDTIVAAKEDCAKLTKDVNALVDANQALVKRIQDAKASGKELPQAAKEKMMARVKEVMPAMNKCSADPGFQAAMKRMEGKSAVAPAKAEPAKEPAKAPAKTDAKAPAKTATPSK